MVDQIVILCMNHDPLRATFAGAAFTAKVRAGQQAVPFCDGVPQDLVLCVGRTMGHWLALIVGDPADSIGRIGNARLAGTVHIVVKGRLVLLRVAPGKGRVNTAAIALAERVSSGEAGAVDDYLSFLGAGSYKEPLEILKEAGVDMAGKEVYEVTVSKFRKLLEEYKSL